jgi:hypothetical protein
MKKIILIMLGLSIGLMADMVRDNTTMIVTDSVTNLQWQDDNTSNTSQVDWEAAIKYCEDNVTLGDFDDWRLPNINELTSLVDETYSDNNWFFPAFKSTITSYYWSSTTFASVSSSAWNVFFYDGLQYYNTKTYSFFVRCVRAGQ